MAFALKTENILNHYREKAFLRYTKDALKTTCAHFEPLSRFRDFLEFYNKHPQSSVPTIDKYDLRKIDVLNVFDTYAADVAKLLSKQWKWNGFFIWDAWAIEKHQDRNVLHFPSAWLFAILYITSIILLLTLSTITWWKSFGIALLVLPVLFTGFLMVFGLLHTLVVLIQWQYIRFQINRRTKTFKQTNVYAIWSAQQREIQTTHDKPNDLPQKPITIQNQPQSVKHNSGLLTIHRVGPSLLTYQYPVNTDALQEIIRENGLIGPHKYQDDEDTIEHIKACDNGWFMFNHPQQQAMLEKDLLKLAKHKIYGAYSFLGAISNRVDKQNKYWKLGAEHGVVECMVSYAISLYTDGYLSDGFYWMKKGADAGDKLGQLLTAVSYQYGTLSEINLEKAASYYQKSIQTKPNYFAYLNLGAMLIDVGCIRTALRYFQKAMEYVQEDFDFNHKEPEECENNITICQHLLQLPFIQRMKMFVQETSTRKLDTIFCDNHQGYTKVSDLFDAPTTEWDPQALGIDVDSLDLQDIETAPAQPTPRPADKDEDYKFPTYKIMINNPSIIGFPRELIFLEKNCHAALNTYIREHLSSLRATFKQIGYSFTYLPSHHFDMEDRMDIIGSYSRAHEGTSPVFAVGYEHPEASEFWQYIQSDSTLPEDCAGILRNIPTGEGDDKDKHFEYILIPYRPGTDWERVFSMLADKLRHEELPAIRRPNKVGNEHKLPEGAYLQIGQDYSITIHSKDGELLTSVLLTPMPKVMLLALLNHPEGLVIKNMMDSREELLGYYRAIGNGKGDEKNIDMLCDPTSNSANEKISRIRQAFTRALELLYKDDLPLFLPTGKRGEAYIITWDRNRVKQQ